jgi:hypothetical protein
MVSKSVIHKFINNFLKGGKQRYWPMIGYVLVISLFFKIGLIIAYFNLSGNIPVLQIYVSGDKMYGALSFSIRVEILSLPLVFLDFKDLIIFPIS